jgi:hypothetical protein
MDHEEDQVGQVGLAMEDGHRPGFIQMELTEELTASPLEELTVVVIT